MEKDSPLERDLFTLHAASFGWAMACAGRDATLAQDILQEAYAKVLSGRARFDGRSSLKTWFFGVVRYTALEHRRWRFIRLLQRDTADESKSAHKLLEENEDARRLSGALKVLPARQREVLHLVFYEDLSINEAATIMQVSIGTARQHYERGKAALRAILSPNLKS